MPQVNDANNPAVTLSHRKKSVRDHPVFIYRRGIGISRYTSQPLLVTLRLVKKLAPINNLFSVLKMLLAIRKRLFLMFQSGSYQTNIIFHVEPPLPVIAFLFRLLSERECFGSSPSVCCTFARLDTRTQVYETPIRGLRG